jgi:hypothetical protein
MKMQVISYDIWGNAKDGFEVNQAFYTGKHVDIGDTDSNMAINRKLGIRGVTWDGDEYCLYGTLKRNGMPALELRVEA